jgi:hypothetical protein
MLKFLLILAVCTVSVFGSTEMASAAAPRLELVSESNRHPDATFLAPRASDATVYIANNPTRASDGRFLDENVVAIDFLTAAEISNGYWSYEDQIDPGSYWVLLRAEASSGCGYPPDYSCADGYSGVLELSVERPTTRFSVTTTLYKNIGLLDLNLKGSPLGVKQLYSVCWRDRSRRKRCKNGTLHGSSWNSAAEDQVTISTAKLVRRTLFTWRERGGGGRVLKSKRVRTA